MRIDPSSKPYASPGAVGPPRQAPEVGVAAKEAAPKTVPKQNLQSQDEGPLRFTVPTGESGGTLTGVRISNSQIRLHDFERRHLAAHRLKAEQAGEGFDLQSQRVRVRTVLTKENKPLAVGGDAQSVLAAPDGKDVVLRELAYLSDLRKTLISGAAADRFFGDSKKAIPNLRLNGGLGSRTRVQQDLDRIGQLSLSKLPGQPGLQSPNVIGAQQQNTSLFKDLLGRLDARINSLKTLLNEDFRKAQSSNPLVIKAQVTGAPENGTTEISVQNEAQRLTVASRVFPKPDQALGLSGSFFINDTEVKVETTDTLYDLARKINFGEDLDRDGLLDGTEDRNFNRVLDYGEDQNQNGLLDTQEDLNENGSLDSGEDLNFNNRLDVNEDVNFNGQIDGGTQDHHVSARIFQFQLLLELQMEGDKDMTITDGFGILKDLGFVDQTVFRQPAFTDIKTQGENASFSINGQPFTQNSNQIDQVSGLSLQIQGENPPGVSVQVTTATDAVVAGFTGLVESFNAVVGELNRTQKEGGIFQDQHAAQRLRIKAVNDSQTRLKDTQSDKTGLPDVGLSPQKTDKLTFSQGAISGVRQRLEQDQLNVFDKASGIGTLIRNLDRVGILTQDDDTLMVDQEKLTNALQSDLSGVQELLTSKEVGILETLGKTVREALGEGGEVELLAQRLGNQELRSLQTRLSELSTRNDPGLDALLNVLA